MLKITVRTETAGTMIEVEGRLAGPWVGELERAWRALPDPRPAPQTVDLSGVTFIDCDLERDLEPVVAAAVDLSGVTFIDCDGKALLVCMWKEGAHLRAAGCLTRCIVDEITRGGPSDSCEAARKDQ